MLHWVRRKSWPRESERARCTIKLADLFCGCGGLTLGAWEGARRTGRRLAIRLALDSDEPPLTVYRRNFVCRPGVAIKAPIQTLFDGQLGARATLIERTLIQRVGAVDLLVAGPPCQGHSDLNNNTRRDDPRNELYLRAVRAAELLKPAVVLIENVPTVVLDRRGVVDQARRLFRTCGYQLTDEIIELVRLGVPQHRKRHVLVATRGRICDLRGFQASLSDGRPTAGQFLSNLEDEPDVLTGPFYRASTMTSQNLKRVDYLFRRRAYNLPDNLRPPCHQDGSHSYVSMYGRMYWDRPSQTITSGFGSMGQGRFVHPKRRRTITPHEAARLQGFPDFFDFSPVSHVTALRKMIGNAVPPQLTMYLVSYFVEQGHL